MTSPDTPQPPPKRNSESPFKTANRSADITAVTRAALAKAPAVAGAAAKEAVRAAAKIKAGHPIPMTQADNSSTARTAGNGRAGSLGIMQASKEYIFGMKLAVYHEDLAVAINAFRIHN